MSTFKIASIFAVPLFVTALVGCGGGGGGNSGPSLPSATPTATLGSTPTPGATATPTPSPLPRLSSPVPLPEGRRIGDNYFALPTSNGDTIDGNTCSVEHFEYHIHSHLSIFLDGRQLAVPAAIGFKNPHFITDSRWPDGFVDHGDCIYSLHTHDTSGKLHVESATQRPYTLGEVFRIWNQPLSRQNIAGITAQPIVFYINDGTNLRRFEGDPNSIELASKREITIQIGTPLSTIPTYQWTSDRVQSAQHEARSAARLHALALQQH